MTTTVLEYLRTSCRYRELRVLQTPRLKHPCRSSFLLICSSDIYEGRRATLRLSSVGGATFQTGKSHFILCIPGAQLQRLPSCISRASKGLLIALLSITPMSYQPLSMGASNRDCAGSHSWKRLCATPMHVGSFGHSSTNESCLLVLHNVSSLNIQYLGCASAPPGTTFS